MKAAVRTRYGPPEVAQIAEVAAPSPGDGELLVQVHAMTVNRTDCHYPAGRSLFIRPLASGLTRPKATVLGNEFAGQVVAAGRGVNDHRHIVRGTHRSVDQTQEFAGPALRRGQLPPHSWSATCPRPVGKAGDRRR